MEPRVFIHIGFKTSGPRALYYFVAAFSYTYRIVSLLWGNFQLESNWVAKTPTPLVILIFVYDYGFPHRSAPSQLRSKARNMGYEKAAKLIDSSNPMSPPVSGSPTVRPFMSNQAAASGDTIEKSLTFPG